MSGRKRLPDQDFQPLQDMGWVAAQVLARGPFPMAIVDATLHYVRVSQAFADFAGRKMIDFPGKPALRNGFSARHKAVMQRVLTTARSQVLKDWTVPKSWQKGMSGYWQWQIMPLQDAQQGLLGLLLWGQDITDWRVLESEIIEAATRERREVGLEIHDNIGQFLAAINMKTKVLECKLEDQQLDGQQETREIRDLVSEVIAMQRRIARLLYPLDVEAGGLLAALENLMDDVTQQFGVSFQVATLAQEPALEHIQSIHIYAIIRGVIEHAVTQAGARSLNVCLSAEPESYVVQVEHDGKVYRRLGAIKGYRLMRFHAHTIGGMLSVNRNTKGQATFVGRFPKMIGQDR